MQYEKSTWQSGDVITSAKLNNMEDGIDKLNYFDINFEFTETPGEATLDKTLAEVQAAHEAGQKVWLTGYIDGAGVRAEVTGFVYNGNSLEAWTANITEDTDGYPTGIYLVVGGGIAAHFNIIPVSQ